MHTLREKMLFAVLILLAALLARTAVQPRLEASALSLRWLARQPVDSRGDVRSLPLPDGGTWRLAGHAQR